MERLPPSRRHGPVPRPGHNLLLRPKTVTMRQHWLGNRIAPRTALHLIATLALATAASGQSGQPLASGQTASPPAPAASNGKIPLRVMLVISDAVQTYKYSYFLTHVDVGRRLAGELQQAMEQAFSVVRSADALPSGPQVLERFDLVVVLEVPQCEAHGAGFSNAMSLVEEFGVRAPDGKEIFHDRVSASNKNHNLYAGADSLSAAVSSQFVQDLLSNAGVRLLLSPAPAQEANAKRDDSAALAFAGLDVAPPIPWQAYGATATNSAAKPPQPDVWP